MLLRERPGSFPNFFTGLPHELLFCFGRWERCTDCRPERNTQSGQNQRLVAAKVEHVAARCGGASRESFHSLGCPTGGLRNAPIDRRGGITDGSPRVAHPRPGLLIG